ncbi:MAG: 4-hydroxymandelate oxidase [Cellvibrionaceae bacterium]|jgi:4-hydroxymandelate oxidase
MAIQNGKTSLINIYDFAEAARDAMSPGHYDFVSGGALDEITLRENHTAFDRMKLNYRVLTGTHKPCLAATIFGDVIDMPIFCAPTGSQKVTHPDGELAVRRAADRFNTIMTVATTSTYPMEEVSKAGSSPVWFQLYLFKDEGLNREIVARAEATGFKAIALTVDSHVFGKRERNIRNNYASPSGIVYENLPNAGESEGREVSAFMNESWKNDLSWSDVAWLRAHTTLPILIKGICHPLDAEMAIEQGADGIWVSNHGGRQLDTAPATIEVLPTIARKVAGRVPIIFDGGIRRGSDVLKAIALGATAVAIGRPTLWGLAVDGQAGVENVLEILRAELELCMALCGCNSLSEITSDLIF